MVIKLDNAIINVWNGAEYQIRISGHDDSIGLCYWNAAQHNWASRTQQ